MAFRDAKLSELDDDVGFSPLSRLSDVERRELVMVSELERPVRRFDWSEMFERFQFFLSLSEELLEKFGTDVVEGGTLEDAAVFWLWGEDVFGGDDGEETDKMSREELRGNILKEPPFRTLGSS